jgi:3-deoxy-D-manno-octulosonate 8-phosphate phosphatase (KDO 8-P phosphatase)
MSDANASNPARTPTASTRPETTRREPTPVAEIEMIVFDVDGVLTDGTLHIHPDGGQSKSFHLRDGLAIVQARKVGLEVGVLSGRADDATLHRMQRLGVEHMVRGSDHKGRDLEAMAEAAGVALSRVAFVGDDLLDLPAMAVCGLAMCPADAATDVRERVDRMLQTPGGYGAAREAIELVLRAKGRWDEVVNRLAAGATRSALPVPGAGLGLISSGPTAAAISASTRSSRARRSRRRRSVRMGRHNSSRRCRAMLAQRRSRPGCEAGSGGVPAGLVVSAAEDAGAVIHIHETGVCRPFLQ